MIKNVYVRTDGLLEYDLSDGWPRLGVDLAHMFMDIARENKAVKE